jgi:hypothetical protein
MKLQLISVLALSLALPALSLPASAAPPRVEGERCYFPVERGTWVGFLNGYYETTGWHGRDVIREVTIWRCFRTKAACTAWKYWAQTDYGRLPPTAWCRRK